MRYQEEAATDGAVDGTTGADTTTDTGTQTVLTDVSDATTVAPQTWPDDWRETYAGEDENKLSALSRYSSPTAAFDGLLAAKERIRSGDLTTPFPDEGTDEAKTTWRTDNGVPNKPEDYNLDLDNGLVIGDNDKEFVEGYLKHAHEGNQAPAQVKDTLQWYYESQAAQMEARNEQDRQAATETTDKLRADWGGEYRPHINSIQGFLDTMPEDIRGDFAAARMADGTPVLSNPQMLQWLLNQSLEINPTTTIVPAGGGDLSSSIADEVATLEGLMGDKNSEYWKGAKSETMQKRYRDLIDARDKIASKG